MMRRSENKISSVPQLTKLGWGLKWLRLTISLTLIASVASIATIRTSSRASAAISSPSAPRAVRSLSSTLATPNVSGSGASGGGAGNTSSIVGRAGIGRVQLLNASSRKGGASSLLLRLGKGKTVTPIKITSPRSAVAPTPEAPHGPTTIALQVLGGTKKVNVPSGATVPFGEPLTFMATIDVASGITPVNGGTVDFIENAGPVYGAGSTVATCQAVTVTAGTAACSLSALAPSATPYTFGATYTPSPGPLLPSSVPLAHEAHVTVSPATTTMTLNASPDPSRSGYQILSATVFDATRGSNLPPTGTIDFEVGGMPLSCALGSADLILASASSSTANCDVLTPTSVTTYSANYVPTGGGFIAPTPAQVTVPGVAQTSATSPSPAPILQPRSTPECSTTFNTLWGASGTITFSPYSSIGKNLASLSINIAAAQSGACVSTTPIDFTSGSLSLFDSKVSGTSLTGYIQDATAPAEPQLCLTGGDLGLYSSTASLSTSGDLCFTIKSATITGGVTSGVVDGISSASFTMSGSVNVGSYVSLNLTSLEFGTGATTLPATCSLKNSTDVWLYVSGSLGLAHLPISNYSGTAASASGCFDFNAKSFNLQAQINGLSYTVGSISLGAPTVTVSASESDGTWTYSAAISASLTAQITAGSSLTVTVAITAVNGGFVLGAATNLSNFLGADAASAWVGYASANVTSFDTGVTGVGTIALNSGLNFAFQITLSSGLQNALSLMKIPAITTAVATGSFSGSTVTASISIGTQGVTMISSGGTSLVLNSLDIELTLSPSTDSLTLSMNAQLNTPSDGQTGDSTGSVALTGSLSAGGTLEDPSASISLSINEPGCATGSGWNNAFGVSGLIVQCATLTGGVSATGPNIGFSGTIQQLPTPVQNAIGLQSGATISFAFNLDPFILSFSITNPSGGVALEPLKTAWPAEASLIQVYTASIYLAPAGGTIGLVNYPAGYSLAFKMKFGDPLNVTVDVEASISISPPSFSFKGSISQIDLGGVLLMGPFNIDISASSSGFTFQFSAALSLSGTWSDSLTKLTGSLSGSIYANVSLSTTGQFQIALSVSASASLLLQEWVGSNCPWYEGGLPVCNPWYWSTWINTGFSVAGGFSLSNQGFTASVTYGGVTYSVTLPFSSQPTPVGAPTPPTPTVALTSSANSSAWAQSVTFTATVSATNFDGNGTVAFEANGADIGGCVSQTLSSSNGSYVATCTTSQSGVTTNLPVGSYPILAVYSGDSTFQSATSSSLNETVSPATPTVTLGLSMTAITYGDPETLTATVTPTDVVGTVEFTDNGTPITGCSALTLIQPTGLGFTTNTASTTCDLPTLPAGKNDIGATYSGDTTNNPPGSVYGATSATSSVTVQPAPLTVTANDQTTTYGGTYPALTASYSGLVNGDTASTENASTTCTSQAPNTGTTPDAGNYVISCTDTDANYSVTYKTGTLTIQPAPLTVTANDQTTTYGGTYPALTASYSGLVNGDTASTENASTTCTPKAPDTGTTPDVGNYAISCTDTDANYSVTYKTGTLTIKPSPTATSLTSSLDPASIGQAVTYTATVKAVTPGGGTPTGMVEFLDNGIAIGACNASVGVTLDVLSPDHASCSVTYPAKGNHVISVKYLGTLDYLASGAGPLGEAIDNCHGSTENCDLAGANLENADLQGENLQGSNLKNSNVSGANVSGVNLEDANLERSNAQGADFQGATLQGANLLDANLSYANLTGANLTGANLTGATWSNTTCPDGTSSTNDGGTCVNNLK